MDDLKSISQGCFVSLPQKHKSSRRSRDTEWNSSARESFYRQTWARLEGDILKCQNEAHVDALDAVVEFVQRTNPSLRNTRDRIEVPTAALIMGVNMSDHAAVFQHLTSKLRKSVTRMIASVQMKDCNSISSMMQKVVLDIVQAVMDDVAVKKNVCTMETLAVLHKSLMGKMQGSPKKHRKSLLKKDDPIVVIIEDTVGFKPSILQDFILICSDYINRLPLVLVLGISTTVMTVHSIVPQRASSCLSIETFASMPVTEYLSHVFQEVLLDPTIPFKLGPHVFQLIVDVVLFHDFSLTNLLHMLKMCLFEHFHSAPESVLCCPEEHINNAVRALSCEEIEEITNLPSFQKYLEEGKHSPRQANTKTLTRFVKELHLHHRKSLIMLRLLYEFSKNLPNSPMGRQFRDVYLTFLGSPIGKSEGFQMLTKLIRVMSFDEIEGRLRSALIVLGEQDASLRELGLCDLNDSISLFIERLEVVGKLAEAKHDDAQESVPVDWGNIRSRSQLKEKLKDIAKTKKQSPFEMLRDDLADYLVKAYSSVCPPTELPLHEVLYFDDAPVIKQYFLPSPRSAMHSALMKPHAYLKCECCKYLESADLSSTLPDMCLAYKLHLEGGKLINLYDWMQSYRSVRTGNKKPSSDEEKLIEAQFFRSVAELQLLGYVRSTRKKTDHVARMTWGSC